MNQSKNETKMKNLFLSQSYLDSWDDYKRSLQKSSFIKWDYIILTASNEMQAEAFRMQIQHRLENHLLPESTQYAVLPDPDGKRVGSGGATFNVLAYLAKQCPENPFRDKRILVIHSGGDSKRVPQYSAVGKLFSPVPRELPDGRCSTLFDEFIIGMSGVPSRMREGMLVLSGDVLLLFNPLQIDAQFSGAAAISIKEPVETGKNHGVFLNDGQGNVKNFLHKQSEETLRQIGAVNEQGAVNLDTGAILLNYDLLQALFGLISTNGNLDPDKFQKFVNEKARISFYGDFLYPLASDSTLEQYYAEKPEGTFCEELKECRTLIWNAISAFSLKLLALSPAQFIHFGTTRELRKLVTEEIQDYEFLDWKGQILSNYAGQQHFAAYSSYIGHNAKVEEGAYLEHSYILNHSVIGKGSIVSHLKLRNITIPSDTVFHGLPLADGKQVVRVYGVLDNPKGTLEEKASFLTSNLEQFLEKNTLTKEDVWDPKDQGKETLERKDCYLWFAKLYPVCDSMESAIESGLLLCKMAAGTASAAEIEVWKKQERTSLWESFNEAEMGIVLAWQQELESRILSRIFIARLSEGIHYKEALQIFGQRGIDGEIYQTLMEDAKYAQFSLKIRIYYALSRYMKDSNKTICGQTYDIPEQLCFSTIQKEISETSMGKLPDSSTYHIAKEQVEVQLPVRVNWGGGWTDTPPYCNENGGIVLNAAIKLNGIFPVQIQVKKIPEYKIAFESQDVGVKGFATTTEEIQDCHNPFDSFALHKAALIACGVIPLTGGEKLEDILKRIGGGIYLSTQVVGIPKGSGLGTSSILAGACVKGIFEFLGIEKNNSEIYDIVLCMEQIMSTGGGWQDQVGGLTPGIKLITSKPGMEQHIEVKEVKVPKAAMAELEERFALIYTGQRRLARNLLRDVIGNYIGARKESLQALQEMKPTAVLMNYYLEAGDIDAFAKELNKHWELSQMLDKGCTNRCIDQIFLSCEDLIDAKFICGAGGGGFLMVILKKGVAKAQLKERLQNIFQDSGVDVWETSFS